MGDTSDHSLENEVADVLREEMDLKGRERWGHGIGFPNTWDEPWKYRETGWMSVTDVTNEVKQRREDLAEKVSRSHVRYWLNQFANQRRAHIDRIRKKKGTPGSPVFMVYKWARDHPIDDIVDRLFSIADSGFIQGYLDAGGRLEEDWEAPAWFRKNVQHDILLILGEIMQIYGVIEGYHPGVQMDDTS